LSGISGSTETFHSGAKRVAAGSLLTSVGLRDDHALELRVRNDAASAVAMPFGSKRTGNSSPHQQQARAVKFIHHLSNDTSIRLGKKRESRCPADLC
jgi:hypothetical protein